MKWNEMDFGLSNGNAKKGLFLRLRREEGNLGKPIFQWMKKAIMSERYFLWKKSSQSLFRSLLQLWKSLSEVTFVNWINRQIGERCQFVFNFVFGQVKVNDTYLVQIYSGSHWMGSLWERGSDFNNQLIIISKWPLTCIRY